MQTLYEWDFRGREHDPQLILKRNIKEFEESFEDIAFVQDLVDGTLKNIDKIDAMIVPVAPDWPLEQIAVIDKTILRVAIFELMLKREVPPKVVINEAVELAKAFGGENSSKFVNGVLGTIYRNSEFYSPEDDKKTDGDENEPKLVAIPEEKFEEAEIETEKKQPKKKTAKKSPTKKKKS